MFYELRQYTIVPGKMDAWVRVMEEEILPFQVACGMIITGIFRGEKDETVFVWMRRFESEAQRERLYAKVYDSDKWKNEIGPQVAGLIEPGGVHVQRIVPTPHSPTQ